MTFSTAPKCPSWEFLFGHTLSLSPIQPDLIGCTPFKFVRSVELCEVGTPGKERLSRHVSLPFVCSVFRLRDSTEMSLLGVWVFLFGHTISLSPNQSNLIGSTPFKFVCSVELCVVGAPEYERLSIIGYLPMEKTKI